MERGWGRRSLRQTCWSSNQRRWGCGGGLPLTSSLATGDLHRATQTCGFRSHSGLPSGSPLGNLEYRGAFQGWQILRADSFSCGAFSEHPPAMPLLQQVPDSTPSTSASNSAGLAPFCSGLLTSGSSQTLRSYLRLLSFTPSCGSVP